MHIVLDARIRRSSTGRYVDRLLHHLQTVDNTNHYSVLVEASDPWQPTAANFSRVPSDFKQFSFNPWEQVRFARLLYRLKPDLVHFTMTQQPLLYLGPTVTTTHDLTLLRYPLAHRLPEWARAIRVRAYRLLFWWAHRKSTKIIVPTRWVAHDLAELQPFTAEKTTVVYEASEPASQIEGEQPDGVSSPFILHVGFPGPHKNLERLVEALGVLHANHPDLKLVLAGKWDYYFERLESAIAAYPARSQVVFTGYVTDAELKWLYENAECYVLPSLSEGFGLPGLEAMAHGCPLASSNATCLPEVYQDAAAYFDPTDVNDMAATVDELLSNGELAADLVARGHKLLRTYSWRTMAEETLRVFESVDAISSRRELR